MQYDWDAKPGTVFHHFKNLLHRNAQDTNILWKSTTTCNIKTKDSIISYNSII